MTDVILDRPLPQAPDAERAVLGAVMIDGRVYHRIADKINAENFFQDAHRTIWRAVHGLAGRGIEIEPLTVKQALSDRGELASVGGVAFISALLGSSPDVANVERYAAIIREKAEARGVLLACNAGMREILNGEPVASVASSLRHVLGKLGVAEDRRSRGIGDVALEVRKRADERAAAGQALGVRTGFRELDKKTGGYRRRCLSLIAGRTSHGKTGVLVNHALGAVGCDTTVGAAVYSLEMGDEPMVNIIRSTLSKVPLSRINEWENIPEYDRDQVLDVDQFLMRQWNSRLHFNDRLADIDDLCADARRLKEERGLDIVFVDYLQLVTGFHSEKNRERVVNQIAKKLFDLAKEIDVAVVALAQVTRPGFDRLTLEDLRESKAIGHDAWLVLMLNRPWQSHKNEVEHLPCFSILQIEKNRGGQTGDIAMHFTGSTQTFTEGGCPDNCREKRNASR